MILGRASAGTGDKGHARSLLSEGWRVGGEWRECCVQRKTQR